MNHSPRANVVATFTGVDGTNVYRSSEGTYHIRPVTVGTPFASDVDEVYMPKVVPLFTDEERAVRMAAFFDVPPSPPPRRRLVVSARSVTHLASPTGVWPKSPNERCLVTNRTVG